MKTSPQDQIYVVGITLMQLIGESLQNSSKKLAIFRTVNCITLIFLTILNFTNYVYIDSNMYVKNAESSVAVFYLLMKYITFIYYKPVIKEICDRREQFWRQQDFNENIRFACDNLFKKTKLVQICVTTGVYIVVFLFILRPYFGSVLIIEMWISEKIIGFDGAVLTLQYYIFYFVGPLAIGYDSFYLAFCVDVGVQVRLLKFKLKHLTRRNVFDPKVELAKCIRHHQFLQFVFKQMRSIYSVTLFFHYFITLSTTCVELYDLLLGHLELPRILGAFMNISMVLNQFAYYVFPAEFVAAEFADVSNAIYMSQWYNCEVGIQTNLCFMMAKAQYLTYFSGAGFIDINIEIFGGLFKKIISFYAVLRNLLNP